MYINILNKNTLFFTFDLCDLGLGAIDLGLMMVNISAKSFQNPSRNGKVMDCTRTKRPRFWPLTSKCDLNLGATDLNLTRNTLSYNGQHFCKVILKSINEPDMKKDPIFDFWPLSVTRPKFCANHIVLWWSIFMLSHFKIHHGIAKLWTRHE